jgi:hypothetical protein
MYFEEKDIPELHFMKHRHDSETDYVDIERNILTRTLSTYLFNNDTLAGFLSRLQRPVSILFDNFNIVKNFKNYIVDKYYYKHKN